MKEEFQKCYELFLKLFSHSTPEELKILRSQLTIKEYSKKELFFRSGETQKRMGYVCKGLLRRYYINDKGNTITTGFVNENKYAIILLLYDKNLLNTFMECLEPSIIIELSYENIQEGYKKFKNNERYGRLIAEYVLTFQTDIVESFLLRRQKKGI